MITKNVTVYLGDGYPVRIPVSQYDTMWRFVFKVVYNDEEWTIPSGATAVLNGRKPDGNVFAFSGTIANNRITVDSDTQLTPVYGEVDCELTISHSSKVVGTANFIVDVEQAPKTNDDVISESALDAYGEILDDIATVTGHMVPSGGSSGQVLAKMSGDDYDTGWINQSGGGGGGSVNDVTVNGTSVVSSGTAAIPTADSSTWGVVKAYYESAATPSDVSVGYVYYGSNSGFSVPMLTPGKKIANGYLNLDATVTSGGSDPVTSGAVYTALGGKISAPSSPATGAFLVWDGTAWVAQTLSTWQGGNY